MDTLRVIYSKEQTFLRMKTWFCVLTEQPISFAVRLFHAHCTCSCSEAGCEAPVENEMDTAQKSEQPSISALMWHHQYEMVSIEKKSEKMGQDVRTW